MHISALSAVAPGGVGRHRLFRGWEDSFALHATDVIRSGLYGPRSDGFVSMRGRAGQAIGTLAWSAELFDGRARLMVKRRRASQSWDWATDHIDLRATSHLFGSRWAFACLVTDQLVRALYLPLGATPPL